MIAIVGAVITGIGSYHLLTGIPLVQADGKIGAGPHVASASELWFAIVGGCPFFILGMTIILSAVNSAITIDPEGITATNLFKRPYFQAAWRDMSAVERFDARPGSGYKVTANGKMLRIDASTPQVNELIAEIKKRAGN
jgi:hypothetical protein